MQKREVTFSDDVLTFVDVVFASSLKTSKSGFSRISRKSVLLHVFIRHVLWLIFQEVN